MAKRKRRSLSGTPAEHRAEASYLVKLTRDGASKTRALLNAAAQQPRKRQQFCRAAFNTMTGMFAAKGAAYRERIGAHGFKRKGFSSANRVGDSLKAKFVAVCMKRRK